MEALRYEPPAVRPPTAARLTINIVTFTPDYQALTRAFEIGTQLGEAPLTTLSAPELARFVHQLDHLWGLALVIEKDLKKMLTQGNNTRNAGPADPENVQ